MRNIALVIGLIISLGLNAQVELAIQKGHSDQIMQLEYSPSGNYLASHSANNEMIIWETNHGKVLASFKLNELEKVEGFKFTEDDAQLKVKTNYGTNFFDIKNSKLTFTGEDKDTLYRRKDYFLDASEQFEVYLDDGAIKKKRIGKRFKKYKLAVKYLNAPFNALDVSIEKNRLIGVAADEVIYVYNYKGGFKLKELRGHNSEINDVRFSPDGKYFATAGKDRSIIIWETESLSPYKRLASNIFQKKTAVFSEDGFRIYVGDELGYIYEIDLGGVFPAVNVTRPNFHSVNKIRRVHNGEKVGYYIATSNNYVYYKENLAAIDPIAKYALRDYKITKSKRLILQSKFNVYQEPFAHAEVFDISPNKRKIVYTGTSEIPNVAFADIETGRVRHLYNHNNWEQWTDVEFTTDSKFISTLDSSNVLYKWKITGKRDQDILLQTDTMPFVLKNFATIDSSNIWLNTVDYGQFIYNLETRKLDKQLEDAADGLFRFENYILMGMLNNEIWVYNLETEQIHHKYKGHSDRISDLNFHPDKDIFVSASEDGTLKLWSLSKKEMIVTLIPFRNKEFVFILEDNNYLISKGAMDEIGFKHGTEYFFPEQFDLKFNRPDKVLDKLGFADEDLIEAYHKAYEKRLKKMNFTEEQLSGDFHLPDAEIKNLADIAPTTEGATQLLDLSFSDSKYALDRVNIWINEVEVKEFNLRDKNTKDFHDRVTLDLAKGRNKIEVSVLNQNGAESYKRTVVVNAEKGKNKPDLYLVTVGVSKYKQEKFDLNYAAKDALDMANTMKESPFFGNIYTKTLTDNAVTLENLAEVRPFLEQAEINDVVMIFVAGHGVLDDNYDYYFASHDMDFLDPATRGIAYEDIEALLDKIKALKKLLFLDTCHSGEVDKDDVEADTTNTENDGELIFRSAGKQIKYKDTPFGLKSTNELMKSLFTDLRRGTGATVISSSGGAEYAIEGAGFTNGLFTYALITGLSNGFADLNEDGTIMVSELQIYIRDEVIKLSKGKQTPTSRIQNNELDYRLW